jgi:hypothetical protein
MGQSDSGELDRRRFLRRAATVAWATPLVLTLGASAAQAQVSPGACLGATGRPDGCPCFATSQCAGGCCCGAPGAQAGGCSTFVTCNDLGAVCL